MTTPFWLLWGVGVVLQLLLLHIMVAQNYYRKFPGVFAFSVILVLTGVVDTTLLITSGHWTIHARNLYWADDLARQVFFATAVISLIYQALRDDPKRNRWRIRLVGLSVGVGTVSLLVHHQKLVNFWLTPVARDISFYALLMNLFLWASLMRSPKADRLMLLLSCGVGLQMAGEAIGQSFRAIGLSYRSRPWIDFGNVVLVLAHLLCLYVWWRAFRSHSRDRSPAALAAISS